MQTFIFNLLKKFCPEELDNIFKKGILKGETESRIEREDKIKQYETQELLNLVGRPVIGVSNEWDDPLIGFVKEVIFITKAQNAVLVVENYLTKEEVCPLGKVFPYTKQRLEAILKLTPFEACSLIYNNFYDYQEFDKIKTSTRHSREEIIQRLTDNGFFHRLQDVVVTEV